MSIHSHHALATLALALSLGAAAAAQDTGSGGTSAATPDLPAKVYALMTTSKGDVVLELNHEKAPTSVENFLRYAGKGAYDGTIFHRVMPNFMIQGGGFEPDMKKRPTDPPIRNESFNGLSNSRGTIAMARTGAPDSATTQFYINVKDNPNLDGDPTTERPGYAVFGTVVKGMDVVDAIRVVETGTVGRYRDVPVETVEITSVRQITPAEAAAMMKKNAVKESTGTPADSAPRRGAGASND